MLHTHFSGNKIRSHSIARYVLYKIRKMRIFSKMDCYWLKNFYNFFFLNLKMLKFYDFQLQILDF